MKFKKVLFPCALAAFMLIGCNPSQNGGEDLKGTYNVTLWVSEVEGVADQFKQQIRAFEALPENEGIKIVETVEGVSESSSATQVLTDVDAAADIYCFAQDQTARLIEGGALAKLGKAAADKVKAENDAGSVLAVTGGMIYTHIHSHPITDTSCIMTRVSLQKTLTSQTLKIFLQSVLQQVTPSQWKPQALPGI